MMFQQSPLRALLQVAALTLIVLLVSSALTATLSQFFYRVGPPGMPGHAMHDAMFVMPPLPPTPAIAPPSMAVRREIQAASAEIRAAAREARIRCEVEKTLKQEMRNLLEEIRI